MFRIRKGISSFDYCKEWNVIGEALSNDPGKVDSNSFYYAATVLSPNGNALIFTHRMHKPTLRPLTQ